MKFRGESKNPGLMPGFSFLNFRVLDGYYRAGTRDQLEGRLITKYLRIAFISEIELLDITRGKCKGITTVFPGINSLLPFR